MHDKEMTINILNETEEEPIELFNENNDEYIETEKEPSIISAPASQNYEELNNKPKINNVELMGNKTFEELGLPFKFVDISTDMTKPTELSNYINESGNYVANNNGIIGLNNEPISIIAKGQMFSILNYKNFPEIFGGEVPDKDNVIIINIPVMDGSDYVITKVGFNEFEQIVTINSKNVNDYVDVDTSNLINKTNNINSIYGIQFNGNYLRTFCATQNDINLGTDSYKPITSNNIDYAVNKKGTKYFFKKTSGEALEQSLQDTNNNLNTLKEEIETILDSVVNINE